MTEYCRPPTRPETLGCPRHHLLYLSTNRGSKGTGSAETRSYICLLAEGLGIARGKNFSKKIKFKKKI